MTISLTSHILPDEQALEFIVHSNTRSLTLVDFSVWLIAIGLLKSTRYICSIVIIVLWLFIKKKSVRQESILSIRDVGIQIKTVYWGGSTVSRFINRLKIEDIIINEGISFWQVKSYIAILVKDQDKMIVVFEHLLPKLDPILLQVYQGTRAIIFSQAYPTDKSFNATHTAAL